MATAVMLCALAGHAQTIYDAVKFTDKDLNGTARFVGMGGAMGALGGDISTIATNPAGIGIYRSSDIMTSFGFSAYGTESNYLGTKLNNDKVQGSFDNIGAVFSTKIGNYTSLRYVNFGFNYKRAKSFYNNTSMEGRINLGAGDVVVNQTYQMANQANTLLDEYGVDLWALDQDGVNLFRRNDVGWLSALGYKGGVILANDEGFGYTGYQPYSKFYSEERGGIDQYDFNVAFNFNDRFYLGLTIGAYDVNYTKYSYYDESYGSDEYGDDEYYFLESNNRIDGSGFDFKVGGILRPFESSPLRIGFAVHTPTFYNLTLTTSAYLQSKFADMEYPAEVDTYEKLGGNDMSREFRLQTPWKYNLSLGYTVGSNLALGAEYEYQDYSTMKFKEPGGYDMDFETSTANDYLKGVSTLRLGAEYKVIPQFALRAGYNYASTAFNDIAYKELPPNSVNTDTDYANAKSKSDYTLGIGYRGDMFYADLAYKFTTYKSDFYAFRDVELKKTDLTNTRSQVLFTLGMRF